MAVAALLAAGAPIPAAEGESGAEVGSSSSPCRPVEVLVELGLLEKAVGQLVELGVDDLGEPACAAVLEALKAALLVDAEALEEAGDLEGAAQNLRWIQDLDPEYEDLPDRLLRLGRKEVEKELDRIETLLDAGLPVRARAELEGLLEGDAEVSLDGRTELLALLAGPRPWRRLRAVALEHGPWILEGLVVLLVLALIVRLSRTFEGGKRLQISTFAGAGSDPPSNEEMSALLSATLQRLAQGSDEAGVLVSGPIEDLEIPELLEPSSLTGLWTNLVKLLSVLLPKPREVHGHLLSAGSRGVGITLELRHRKAVLASQTFWQQGLVEKAVSLEPGVAWKRLVEAAAVWLLYGIRARDSVSGAKQELLGTSDWQAYAHLQLGVLAHEVREFEQARFHFLESLKLDRTFTAARINLVRVWRHVPAELVDLLQNALAPTYPHRFEKRLDAPALTQAAVDASGTLDRLGQGVGDGSRPGLADADWDPSTYKALYNLAAFALNAAMARAIADLEAQPPATALQDDTVLGYLAIAANALGELSSKMNLAMNALAVREGESFASSDASAGRNEERLRLFLVGFAEITQPLAAGLEILATGSADLVDKLKVRWRSLTSADALYNAAATLSLLGWRNTGSGADLTEIARATVSFLERALWLEPSWAADPSQGSLFAWLRDLTQPQELVERIESLLGPPARPEADHSLAVVRATGPAHAATLAEDESIEDAVALFDACKSRDDRQALAGVLGIDAQTALALARRIELAVRIAGLELEHLDLLQAAGIDRLKSLRKQGSSIDTLARIQSQEASGSFEVSISAAELANWNAEAQGLRSVVEV